MANLTMNPLTGNCIPPFFDVTKFPTDGGYTSGRLCAPLLPGDTASPVCCLPCPVTDWIYPDNFDKYSTLSGWLNVLGAVLLVFMLLSYLVLPAQETKRHYLSICMTVSILFIAIGFITPLAAQPQECYNEITPNDMYTSMECAWSGAFIVAGGLSTVAWIFLRALSMNLQICFDIVPGRKFFYASQAFGWGIPAILFAVTMIFTGVSFRFGSACHVNHENSMADFWGPLLGMAGAAGFMQFITFAYCIKVYLKNLWTDNSAPASSNGSTQINAHPGNLGTYTARAVWRRLKKVLWLQWRAITIVTIILIDVIFFSIVFVYMDAAQTSAMTDQEKIMPWVFCLAGNPHDKDKCVPLAEHWLVNESMVLAVLMLLALAGLQLFIFMMRPTVFSSWLTYFRSKLSRKQEYSSHDLKTTDSDDEGRLELLKGGSSPIHFETSFEMHKPEGRVTVPPFSSVHKSLSSPTEIYRTSITKASPATPFDERHSPTQFPLHESYPRSPPVVATSTPFDRRSAEPGEYFQLPRRPPTRPDNPDTSPEPTRQSSASPDRHYHAPTKSFSTPKQPSTHTFVRVSSQEDHSYTSASLQPPKEISARELAEEAEFALWRQHDLWARDNRFKRT